MDLLVLGGAYVVALGLVFFALLFGEQQRFKRTPISFINWLITEATCVAIERLVERTCGERGRRCLAATGEACCERSNPAVQVLFLLLLGGGYTLYSRHIFPLLPGAGLSTWHVYTGSAAAVACLLCFAAASFCDPGYITRQNLEQHLALYPHDSLLFEPCRCPTCGLMKPARSKHCRISNRCIARSDHFCVWLNATVGLLNMRWFLLLLAAVALTCAYGAVIAVLAVLGDMQRRDAWSLAYVHPRTHKLIFVGDSYYTTAQYITRSYGVHAALTLFLTVMGWVVFGFLGYHLWLIVAGVTTNETFKQRDVRAALQEQAEQTALLQRVDCLLAGADKQTNQQAAQGQQAAQQRGQQGNEAGTSSGSGGNRSREGCAAQLPPHPYNRGVWQNFSEIIWPHWHLRHAAAVKKHS